MSVLVFIECRAGEPTEDSLGIVSRLNALGQKASTVVCGSGIAAAADIVARHGPAEVLAIDDARLGQPQATPIAAAIEALVRSEGHDTVLLGTSVLATEIAASLAARLEAGLVWSMCDIAFADGAPVGQRATHGDTMRAESVWTTPQRIGLFRPRCFSPDLPGDRTAPIRTIALAPDTAASPIELVVSPAEITDSSLADAEIIVSGGRGLGKAENLELVRELAAEIGGVAGVSLPLVDMGWAPRAMQVGQTGTVVRPRLYIACGISGQIQHRMGMERSGVIVAINTDREAPIMRFCDLGVVGDAVAVIKGLTEQLRARNG